MIFDLKTYMKLKEQIKEMNGNQSSHGLDGKDESMIPQAEELLSKAELTITLDEIRELQEQAKEKRKNPMLNTIFAFEYTNPDEIMVSTEKATEAKEILSKAKLTITLDEMRELQKQAKERRKDPMYKPGLIESMVLTVEAEKAEKILSKAELKITLDEMRKLQEQARERKENPTYEFPTESGGRDNRMVQTEKAKEAEKILSNAKLTITLDEMRKLQEQTRERKENPTYEFPTESGGRDNRMVKTEKAKEAEAILSKARLTITLDEMKELQAKAEEKKENPMYKPGLIDSIMVPTTEAQIAKGILNLPNLTIAEGKIRENNYTISTKDIGAKTINVSPITKEEVKNPERNEGTKGQEIGGE